MNDESQKILKALEDPITKGERVRSLLRKEFTLGMTKWVCRHGTLGEGHENGFDVGQVYPQALRETYHRYFEASRQAAIARKAQARLIRAKDALKNALTQADEMDAAADCELAQLDLMQAYDNALDLKAQFEEFEKITHELEGEFRKKYPEGIEQAQPEIWKKVMNYRCMTNTETKSIPLPAEEKAQIGLLHGKFSALANLVVTDEEKALSYKDAALKMIEKTEANGKLTHVD